MKECPKCDICYSDNVTVCPADGTSTRLSLPGEKILAGRYILEQRIGRLDRIGQTEDIKIHVPYIIGSPLEMLARWYHEGVDAFPDGAITRHPVHVTAAAEGIERAGQVGRVGDALAADGRRVHPRQVDAGNERF